MKVKERRKYGEDCGITRQTFYYHFADIYDLVEWIFTSEATQALNGEKIYVTWKEGFLHVFSMCLIISFGKFFGTLKTECLYCMKFSCRDEVEQAVAEYVQFYNYERINLKNGLTPSEIRSKAA